MRSDNVHNVWYFVILVAAIAIYYFVDVASCNAKTEGMGFEHRYSLFGGCQIEVNDGQWIPLESYYFKQE